MKKAKKKRQRLLKTAAPAKSLSPVFAGEWMTCIMCGAAGPAARQHQSDPAVENHWRALDVDGQRFYACPEEFPPDGAPTQEFTHAYMRIFLQILTMRGRNGNGR